MKFCFLADEYDEKVIWDFLLTKGITKENIIKNMSYRDNEQEGCITIDCEATELLHLGFSNIGYIKSKNKIIDVDNINEEEFQSRSIVHLEPLDMWYCPACGIFYIILNNS